MSNVDYGGDEMVDGEEIAAIVEALRSHEHRLDGHATLEVRAWDDGDMTAELSHTVGIVPGAAGLEPATMKQAIAYVHETRHIEYREYALRAGEKDVQTRIVLEGVHENER